jgi:hypothetical protein
VRVVYEVADVVEKNLASFRKLAVGFVFSGWIRKHAVLFAPAGMAGWAVSRYL